MTREIKFRAWLKKAQQMVEIDKFDFRNQIISFGFHEGEANNAEIMQFTGLKDKNGKEIYEGDIINNGDINIKYVIEFIESGFRARQLGNQSTIGLEYWRKQIEIIGNRWENPELLANLNNQ